MGKKSSLPLLIAATLVVPTTVFALAKWAEKKWAAPPVYAGQSQSTIDFQLQNQAGQTVSLKSWRSKIVVADFFFTHCTTICPKMTAGLKKVYTAFENDSSLLLNSFSVDPERDSVQRLKTYAAQFGILGNWNLLTGSKKEIYQLARNSFSLSPDEAGGEQDFIHTEKTVLLDQQQRIRGYYNATQENEIQRLINDIKKLKDED